MMVGTFRLSTGRRILFSNTIILRLES